MGRPTKITIHLDALHHNLQRVRQLAPHSAILAMVKSNAYGHGIERIALALSEADALGVACIEEGMILRQVGVTLPIVLLEGLFTGEELSVAASNHFTLVIHHEAQVKMLEETPLTTPVPVWLKIDTGMHRLGFDPSLVKKTYQRLMHSASVKKPIGLMTHFASSDALDQETTLNQIHCFKQATADLEGPRSLCNSAAIMTCPDAHADWVRPGIMLYGASPFKDQYGNEHQLRPVMSLSSQLIAIHQIAKGEKVGYNGIWAAPKDMLMGVVGIGYGDGYPQFAKSGTPVIVNGAYCPLIGRVSMDMLTVDLSSQPHAKVGDPVLLWGPSLPVEKVAANNGTSAYELLTRMMQRVPVYIEDGNQHSF